MDAMQSFLRKYSAVPANATGPQWTKATDEALLGWFQPNVGIVQSGWNKEQKREATPQERKALMSTYNEIVAELDRRRQLPDCSPEIYAAWVRSKL